MVNNCVSYQDKIRMGSSSYSMVHTKIRLGRVFTFILVSDKLFT